MWQHNFHNVMMTVLNDLLSVKTVQTSCIQDVMSVLHVAPLILVLGQLLAVPCILVAALASWPSRVTVKYTGLVFDRHTCRLTCCLAVASQ